MPNPFEDIWNGIKNIPNYVATGAEHLGTAIKSIPGDIAGIPGNIKHYLWTDRKIIPAPAQSTTTTTTKTKRPKKTNTPVDTTHYAQGFASLLHPFTEAVGQLPPEYSSLMNHALSATTFTPSHSDQMAIDLAKQYGGEDITAHPTGPISGALSHFETALKTAYEPGGQYSQALSNLGTDMNSFAQVAPYKDLLTALFNHMRYTAIYNSGQFQGVQNWPSWMQHIYHAMGGTITQSGGAGGGFTSSIPMVPGLSNRLGAAATATPTAPAMTPTTPG